MSAPLPVKIALAGSVILGTAGLCELLGVFAAMGAAGLSWGLIPLLIAGFVSALIVCGGEMVKSRLLQWSQEADGWRIMLARGGWAFFIALSIFLSHSGLVATERAILSPVLAPIEQTLEQARSSLDEAQRAEAAERSRIDARILELRETADLGMTRRERDQAREALAYMRSEESEVMRRAERVTAEARRDLAEAQSALDRAPKGFLSLSISIPFVGEIAIVAWLIPLAIEYITGLVGWISSPRRAGRVILHEDILSLDPAGLELIDDIDLLRRLTSKHQSLGAKGSYVIRARERKAS
jgi:hypothetical protein